MSNNTLTILEKIKKETENFTQFKYFLPDPEIFTDEKLKEYNKISEEQRFYFITELYREFANNNPEYESFITTATYKDPLLLLEFFKNIKKSHFKKAGIDPEIFPAFEEELKTTDNYIKSNPLKINNIISSEDFSILRLKSFFTESQLARLFYIQYPKEENTDNDGYYLPFGAWLPTISSAIGHATVKREYKYEVTKTGKKKNDRGKEITVKPTNAGFELIQKNKHGYSSITVINKDLIQSTTALKLFVFLLAKAAQQNFKPVIIFSLQDLVNNGMYTNKNNARAGFKKQISAVQSLQIAGEIKKGKKEIKQAGGVLFYQYDIDNNIIKVWVNESFDIEFLASYYMYLPRWAFELSNNAFELLLYIYEIARIERKTKFNISLATIRDKLTLPTKEEYLEKNKKWKPSQYVKTPIIEAIEAIENTIKLNNDNTVSISKHFVIDNQNLEEWLKGYITINLTGEYSQKIESIKEKQSQIIEKNKKRKEAITAAADLKKIKKEE